jgi:arylformamidase
LRLVGGWYVDLTRPVSLARDWTFDQPGPRYFGAPPPVTQPLEVGSFTGRISRGASCNCSTIRLTPHGDGTHTECAGHLTAEPLDACDVLPRGLLRAVVLSVAAEPAAESTEDSDPTPQPRDRLVTAAALARAWPQDLAARRRFAALSGALPDAPLAAIVRVGKGRVRSASARGGLDSAAAPAAPFLTRQAAQWLVEREVRHLIVELPSIDRAADEGRLCAHRVFFGMPAYGHRLADARRRDATVTELAQIPRALEDGPALLQLTAPHVPGDAVPSRPLVYPLQSRPKARAAAPRRARARASARGAKSRPRR